MSFILLLLTAAVFMTPNTSVIERAPRHGGVFVVAHRGLHDGIPENTLAAYRAAIEAGADFVEIDLRETKDGHLVSVHNHTVDAYTEDARGPVHEFSLEELRALNIGSPVAPEWADERIPTFEEILALCQGRIGIYLDLKQGSVDKMVALVRQYDMTHDVLWYASTMHLRQLRETCPECILMPDPGPEQNLPRTFDLFTPQVVASVWRHLSESFVRICHEAGTLVIVDDGGPDSWDTLLAWGVDGIQTDQVNELIEYLKTRNGHVPESSKPR